MILGNLYLSAVLLSLMYPIAPSLPAIAVNAQTKGLAKGQKVVYRPPKNIGAPRHTVGALSRSGDCKGSQCLAPLLPVDTEGKLNHFPLTGSDRPTFFINVPITSGNVIFTLYSASTSGDLERRVFRTIFPIACTSSGIFRFSLPPNSPPLDVDSNYAWEFAVGRNRAKGLVRRIKLSSNLIDQIDRMNPLERASTYANEGIWFDSLESLAELRASQPNNSDAITAWKELLIANELKEIADQPIAQCK